MSTPKRPPFGRLPRIYGTQFGLRDPALIDALKADRASGRFDYQNPSSRIHGLCDPAGNCYVKDGHHRVVAAMELLRETGDSTALTQLVLCAKWDLRPNPPIDWCPLPSRQWWRSLLNWLFHSI